jgi:hypothetical protein
VAYEHLGLTRWPFPVVPDREFCTFIADRAQLRTDLTKLLRTLTRQDASSIHLLWSWFGAGKTHTLFYMANHSATTAQQLGGRLHAVYSEFPKSPRSFLDVYRAFATGLDLDELIDAYLEVSTSPESGRIHREMLLASPDLTTALQILAQGTSMDQVVAMRWFRAESLPAGEFRKVGISQKLATSEEASRVLAALVKLLGLAARSRNRPTCRVLWLLDEYQRIATLRPAVRDEISTGLHSTFNACPSGLSIVLSFSGKPEEEFPPWFSPELRDRIGRTRVILLPPLRSDEALDFVRDVLKQFRTLEAHDAPSFFPFTEEACRCIIEEVGATAELKPRAIMQAFDAVLRETEPELQAGELEEITPAIAKRILRDFISLTAIEGAS